MLENSSYANILVVAVLVSAGTLTASQLAENPVMESIQGTSENVDFEREANVEVYKNGDKVAETHNVLMEGEAIIEQAIKTGTSDSYTVISVGNGSEPTTDSGSLDSEIGNCGLSPKDAASNSGVEDINGDDGNWNLTVTYDVTCDDVDVNTTAQKASGSPGADYDYFAGAALGRTINLYSGDSLTIEWSNEVTNN